MESQTEDTRVQTPSHKESSEKDETMDKGRLGGNVTTWWSTAPWNQHLVELLELVDQPTLEPISKAGKPLRVDKHKFQDKATARVGARTRSRVQD